jgi:(p)ppGpp synthase/HD superfamily hydrolase
MRTLDSLPPHKRKRIADETLEVFAPLAKLLGMYRLKDELEALAFRWSDPAAHEELLRWRDELSARQAPVVDSAVLALRSAFERDEFLQLACERVEVEVRCKELFAVHRKRRESGKELQEVQDVAQIRVIAHLRTAAADASAQRPAPLSSGTSVCYHILGLVHALWPPIPGRVKDYVAMPKPNGYRALHTQVLPFGSEDPFPLELQIRTAEMHRSAECGIVADAAVMASWHAASREAPAAGLDGGAAAVNDVQTMHSGVRWLTNLREWQASPLLVLRSLSTAHLVSQTDFLGDLTAREWVDTITGDLLVSGGRVFVFSPKGQVLTLPRGATAVDYAYHIHTDVGNRCVTLSRVRALMRSLTAPLQDGLLQDQRRRRLARAGSAEWGPGQRGDLPRRAHSQVVRAARQLADAGQHALDAPQAAQVPPRPRGAEGGCGRRERRRGD